LSISIVDKLDFKSIEYMQWMYLQLNIYPITSVQEVNLKWGADELVIAFPSTWFKVWHRTGQIQLLPSLATINSLLFAQIGLVSPLLNRNSYFPQMLEVKYNAGLATDANNVPSLINQIIGLYAAINVLSIIGSIGVGPYPGVSNMSLSLDGMSQNVGTSLTATTHLYSSTVTAYQAMLKDQLLPLVKRMYSRIKLTYI